MADSIFLGTGDVRGPASSTDGALAAFDGTSGKLIKVGSAAGVFVSSITGTANQVIASAATGAVTLSLPQSIATTSSVVFGRVTVADYILSSGTSDIGVNGTSGGFRNVFLSGYIQSSGTGPYSFGFGASATPVNTEWQWTLGGTYAPAHAAVGGMMRWVTNITMPDASAGTFMDPRGLSIQNTWNFGGKAGTVGEGVHQVELDTPTISNAGSATIPYFANLILYPGAAGTFTDKSYSLFVKGKTRFDDEIYFSTLSAAISASNSVQMTRSGNTLLFKKGDGAAGASLSMNTTAYDGGQTIDGSTSGTTDLYQGTTTAQVFKVFRTRADASNYAALWAGFNGSLGPGDGHAVVMTKKSGSGTARDLWVGTADASVLKLATNDTAAWQVTAAGNFADLGTHTFTAGSTIRSDSGFNVNGTAGATAGPFSTITSIRAIGGLVTVLTGS